MGGLLILLVIALFFSVISRQVVHGMKQYIALREAGMLDGNSGGSTDRPRRPGRRPPSLERYNQVGATPWNINNQGR